MTQAFEKLLPHLKDALRNMPAPHPGPFAKHEVQTTITLPFKDTGQYEHDLEVFGRDVEEIKGWFAAIGLKENSKKTKSDPEAQPTAPEEGCYDIGVQVEVSDRSMMDRLLAKKNPYPLPFKITLNEKDWGRILQHLPSPQILLVYDRTRPERKDMCNMWEAQLMGGGVAKDHIHRLDISEVTPSALAEYDAIATTIPGRKGVSENMTDEEKKFFDALYMMMEQYPSRPIVHMGNLSNLDIRVPEELAAHITQAKGIKEVHGIPDAILASLQTPGRLITGEKVIALDPVPTQGRVLGGGNPVG